MSDDNNKHIPIEEIEKEIIDEFTLFDNWDDRYEYIIELGKKLPPLDEKHKVPENKIKGCQSNVWMIAEFDGARIHYKAESDSIIVKGLVSLLLRVLSNHTPDEIINAKLAFIDEIGMTQHLAQTRANGLLAMVKQIKYYAMAYKTKQEA